ncbi:MAG TPA: DUF5916 domain-containing protein [Candidatus Polarisedimenticolia bacterium]|jgi:hypothetical protein|nr:DUF5916 domain-containing protein [Candidatus Polarisedimenticolia bacterium]
MQRYGIPLVAILASWGTCAGAEPTPAEASGGPIARAVRCESAIRVDGVLDEPCWQAAEPLKDFVQHLPAEGAPATQPTEVRLLFDAENLYVGADLADAEPGRIIALEMKEDGDLRNDDLFGIMLDTFHDRRNAFYFEANPNGARGDALVYDEGRVQSFDWDGVWQVQSRITDRGWTVEMQIPFKTLHFEPGRTNPWGLQLWRYIRRSTEDVFWGRLSRNEDLFRVSRAGTLTGLEDIRQGKSLALKPYALGGADRQPSLGASGTERENEIGLDARYDLTPNLAAVLTLNTDFAETEVDDQQVNTSRFPLFFPEKREFFLESTGFFDFGYNRTGPGAPPGLQPFFSRRIGLSASALPIPILGGAKMAGRIGRTNLGFLSILADDAEGQPHTNFSVLRLSRDVLARSNFGLIAIGKEPSGPDDPVDPADPSAGTHSNRTYGVDLNLSVLQNLKFGGSILQTRTPGLGTSQGAGHAYANWSDDTWDVQFSHRDIGPGFNPEVGFVQRTGIEESEGFLAWSWRSRTALVRRVEPHTRHIYTSWQDHHLATRFQHWALSLEFRDGSGIEVGYQPTFDSLRETFTLDAGDDADPADDVEVRPGAYHPAYWLLRYDGNASRPLSASLAMEAGDFFDGEYRFVDLGATARISRHVRFGTGVRRTEIDLPSRPADATSPALPPSEFNPTLLYARWGLYATTRLLADVFVQYNSALDDLSTNLRFNYKYRPGSDLYVVYTERRDREGLPSDVVDRSLTVKWTCLFSF